MASSPRDGVPAAPPWHALDSGEVQAALRTSLAGLAAAEVRARRARAGPNKLEDEPPTSVVELALRQFRSPLIYTLLAAAAVTVFLGEYTDAGVILAAVLINAAIGFPQERRAERAARALTRLTAPRARVIRDTREREIDSAELVPGDLVLLQTGSRVPADLRLVSTNALAVDESLLTGESVPVAKGTGRLPSDTPLAERANLAFMGATITRGRGFGYVVATGARTELGTVARTMREEKRVATPLQRRLGQLSRVIGVVVAICAALAFVLGLALGEEPGLMFRVAVGLAVAAVPEGLPVVVTIALALGVRRMARRGALVRQLPAVETLGSVTVIGSDKTGTLTENRMTVEEIWSGGVVFTLTGDARGAATVHCAGAPLTEPLAEAGLYRTLLAGVLSNEADVYLADGAFEVHGDPTEAALLIAATRLGLEPQETRAAYPVYAEIPFEPERQFSASIRVVDGHHEVFVKGAPERVLQMCDSMLRGPAVGAVQREQVLQAAHAMAARGLRVLGMAWGRPPVPPSTVAEGWQPAGLTLLGLQGMLDPPRTGVREAIAGCQQAGIRVLMITGDHASTARAIGASLGIAPTTGAVLRGADLETLDEEGLRAQVQQVSIFARVSAEHKLRIVRALQQSGEVVAVTGDGVNDAAALKGADVGVAMGRSGTDVAREAADVVLSDDNFVTISAAVEEGRVTFDNLRKVTFFLTSTGAAAILALLTALVLEWPLPLLPAQLIWLNLVTNGLQDVAMAFEPGERNVLRRPPRRRDAGLMSALLWERGLVAAVVMAAGTLYLFSWTLDNTGSLGQAQAAALTTMVLFQNFQVGNARSEFDSVFRRSPLSNRFLFLAAASALLVHISALHLGPTQFLLQVEPIEAGVWVRILLVSLAIVPAMELHKLVRWRAR